MSKQKKVHQIGAPRKSRGKHHGQANAAELHKLAHPRQSAAATSGNDHSAARGLKEASENVGKAVKREVEQLRRDFGQLAAAGSVLKNARSARQFASIIIDVGE